MNKLTAFATCAILTCIFSCKKKDQLPVNPPTPPVSDIIAAENTRFSTAVTSQTITAFISGTIIDEDGKSLVGVSVTAGSTTVTTNDKGYFQFPASVTVNKDYAIITASLNGYFKATRTFTPNASGKANHYFEIKLMKPGAEKTVAATGGNVVLDNKVDITFPDAAVVTAAGSAYTGQYKVVARYIDPSSANFLETMPGMLAGLNDQNQVQALQSFGMAIVELKDASGNALQLAPGKKATLKLPAPANSPATIPLWHFNEKYGLWIQAGVATKTGDSYVAEVNHFSTWNLDVKGNSFTLNLQFKDPLGNAISGVKAELYMDGNKIIFFYSDNEGKATLQNCPASKPLTLKIIFQCDTTSKTLDALTANRSEVITVPYGTSIKSYTITGKISGCDNVALVNQPFKMAMQGDGPSVGLPGVTDAQGNYTVTAMICNNSPSVTVQASAFINNEYRYASATNMSSSTGTYNAKICDTTSGIADDFEIVFPDPSLDSVMRLRINKPVGVILYRDVKNLESFDALAPIRDLSGLQFCSNLKVLSLRDLKAGDLGPFKNLLGLERLTIFMYSKAEDSLKDLSPLQNLTQLQNILLQGTKVSDLSPLQNLVHLKSLNIHSYGNLSNLSPLVNLAELSNLNISNNGVSDLSALQNLPQLKYLALNSQSLTNASLDVLPNFPQLTGLQIFCTFLTDVSVVKNLSRLTSLSLSVNYINDLSQFLPLPNLDTLALSGNTITSISELQTMPQLKYLDLSNNQISDISPLQTLTQLQDIRLTFNRVSNISSLANRPLLKTAYLENNLVSILTPLQNLNNLENLFLTNNNISDITPLTNGVPQLKYLGVVTQKTGTIPQAQQDAFRSNHPSCLVF